MPCRNLSIEQFKKERDETLLSLDKQRILDYCKRHHILLPDDELSFWAGIHTAIYAIHSATYEQKEASRQWLMQFGFSPK